MARFVLFIAFVILSLHNSIAQPISYPELRLVRHSLSGIPFFNRFVVITFDLELTDGQKKVYDEMMKEVRDFVKQFEEEKEKLEREYQGSSGEARIQKARALLNFVLRSEEAWQKLTVGMGTEWEGTYSCNADFFGIIKATAKGDTKINLGGLSDGSLSSNAKTLTGTIDGTFALDMNAHSVVIIEGFYTSKSELNGSSQTGKTWLTKLKTDYKSTDGELVIVGPWFAGYAVTKSGVTVSNTYTTVLGAYSYAKGDGTHTSGYVVMRDLLTGMYVRRDFNITHEPPEDFYFWFEYSDPLTDNINFQELKDKYFRFYISDISKFRLQQYNSVDDLDQKASIGQRTLAELVSAESFGQLIGVSENVFHELMLVHQTQGSLYDTWFRLWFNPSDGSWKKKIDARGSEKTQITNLEGRVKNVIEAIIKGQMIASDELMQELQLFARSNFVSAVIDEYFEKTNQIHCSNVLAKNMTLDQYTQWLVQVAGTALVYANNTVLAKVSSTNCPTQ